MILKDYKPNYNTQEFIEEMIFHSFPQAKVNEIIPYFFSLAPNASIEVNSQVLYFGVLNAADGITYELKGTAFKCGGPVSQNNFLLFDKVKAGTTVGVQFTGWQITLDNNIQQIYNYSPGAVDTPTPLDYTMYTAYQEIQNLDISDSSAKPSHYETFNCRMYFVPNGYAGHYKVNIDGGGLSRQFGDYYGASYPDIPNWWDITNDTDLQAVDPDAVITIRTVKLDALLAEIPSTIKVETFTLKEKRVIKFTADKVAKKGYLSYPKLFADGYKIYWSAANGGAERYDQPRLIAVDAADNTKTVRGYSLSQLDWLDLGDRYQYTFDLTTAFGGSDYLGLDFAYYGVANGTPAGGAHLTTEQMIYENMIVPEFNSGVAVFAAGDVLVSDTVNDYEKNINLRAAPNAKVTVKVVYTTNMTDAELAISLQGTDFKGRSGETVQLQALGSGYVPAKLVLSKGTFNDGKYINVYLTIMSVTAGSIGEPHTWEFEKYPS